MIGCPQEHRKESLRANHPSHLTEGEKGQECNEDDQHASQQLVHAKGSQREQPAKCTVATDHSLDHMFENGEQQHQEAKKDRLIDHGHDQWLLLKAPAEAKHFANKDDLGDDQRFDQRNSVVKIGHSGFSKHQSAIDGEGAQNDP